MKILPRGFQNFLSRFVQRKKSTVEPFNDVFPNAGDSSPQTSPRKKAQDKTIAAGDYVSTGKLETEEQCVQPIPLETAPECVPEGVGTAASELASLRNVQMLLECKISNQADELHSLQTRQSELQVELQQSLCLQQETRDREFKLQARVRELEAELRDARDAVKAKFSRATSEDLQDELQPSPSSTSCSEAASALAQAQKRMNRERKKLKVITFAGDNSVDEHAQINEAKRHTTDCCFNKKEAKDTQDTKPRKNVEITEPRSLTDSSPSRGIRDRVPTGHCSMQQLLEGGKLTDEDQEDDDAWDKTAFEGGRARVPRGHTQTGHVVIDFKGARPEQENPPEEICFAEERGDSKKHMGPQLVVRSSLKGNEISLHDALLSISENTDAPSASTGSPRHMMPESGRRRCSAETSHSSLESASVKQPAIGDSRCRRNREKTHSTFVKQETMQEMIRTEEENEQDDFDTAPRKSLSSRTSCEESLNDPGVTSHEETKANVRAAYEDHLMAIHRYSSWLRAEGNQEHKISAKDGATERRCSLKRRDVDIPRDPIGTLIKGIGTTETIAETDVAMLGEAMPLAVNALGINPEAAAYSFRAFHVEAGKEIWREDTTIDHVYIIGEGASISMSRAGRLIRDVGIGQSLGAEALQHKCRWQHTGVVRRGGLVWAMEAFAFRELITMASSSQDGYDQVHSLLGESPMLKNARLIQNIMLAAYGEHINVDENAWAFQEGDDASCLYVLKSGAVAVMQNGELLRQYLTPGSTFGERAFLRENGRRTASCLAAAANTSLIALPYGLLSTVFGDAAETYLHKNIVHQTLHGSLSGPFMKNVRHESLELWIERCAIHRFPARENILDAIDKNELDLGGLFVVLDGEVATCCRSESGHIRTTVIQPYHVLGEDHLLEAPSSWLQSLTAGDAELAIAVLPRSWWQQVFMGCATVTALVAFQQRIELVRKVFLFRHLSENQCMELVSSMTLSTKKKGEIVIKEGDKGNDFFLIHEGDVAVSKNTNFITKLSQPAYFGERALLYEEPRAATVTVASEEATFCVLTKQLFLEILSKGVLDFIAYRNKLLDTDLQFSDLEEQKVIGRGGYGIVKLVRHKKSGFRYALKCVTRDRLSDKDRSLVQRERAVLQLIDHPFCLKLARTFKDSNCVYFLTELVTGGELLDALDRLDVLSKNQAQFYLGSLLVVFEYIHEKNIIYRDLKPENVLLDQDGFIKLIDFGAARQISNPAQKCFTLLGTPHFMAVEMILGHGYGMSADVWAMGVCVYEFMVGRLPFDGDKPVAIFRQIASKKPVWIPDDLDPATVDMLRWLLQRNPADRVQATEKGYLSMKEHPFFQGFDFAALVNRSVKPPYVPPTEQYSEDAPSKTLLALDECTDTTLVDEATEWDAEF